MIERYFEFEYYAKFAAIEMNEPPYGVGDHFDTLDLL